MIWIVCDFANGAAAAPFDSMQLPTLMSPLQILYGAEQKSEAKHSLQQLFIAEDVRYMDTCARMW